MIRVCGVARGVLKREPSVLKNSTIKPGHRRARSRGGWLRATTLTALTAGVALASTAHADVDAGATLPGEQSGNVTIAAPMRSSVLRTQATKVQWISHQDCIDNIQLTFNPVVTMLATGKALVAFVSNTVDDCKQNSTRNDPTRCHHLPVVSGTESQGSPLVTFKAQDLTELMNVANCGDDVADAGTANATAPLSLKIYFMVAPPAEDLVAGNPNINFAIFSDSGIDLWGPPPPTGLMVASGDEALQITFTDGANEASDRLGYYIYVDDGTGKADGGASMTTTTGGATSTGAGVTTGVGAGGSTASSSSTATAGGAGGASSTSTTGVGGNGGASTSSSSASSASSTSSVAATSGGATTTTGSATPSAGVTSGGNTDACNPSTVVGTCTAASLSLVPGATPSDVSLDAVQTGNVGQVSSLKNGKGYVVAMAAYDDVGNIGKLSALACGAPAPVDSILRVYKCDGGLTETGCGFCSMGGDRGGSFGALVSAGLVVAGFAARRTRRHRAARASRGAR